MKSEKVTLISCDGVSFEVDKAVAIQSGTIKEMIDEDGAGNVFTLHNVDSWMLQAVVIFLNHSLSAEIEKLSIDHELDDLYVRKMRHAATAAGAAAANVGADRDLREVQIKSLAAKEKHNHWDAMFVMVDQNTLFDLIRAADYLDIPGLLALCRHAFFDRFGLEVGIPDDISVIFDNMFASGILYDSA